MLTNHVVVVHEDAGFTNQCGDALRAAGYVVSEFVDPLEAWDHLRTALTNVLISTLAVYAA